MSAPSAPTRWLVVSLLLAPALGGAQDWPCARHDPQRTGAAAGPLRLPAPAVRWRHYLGGQLRDDQWRVDDVDGDGVTDVVFVASGKVICKHADDLLVWESELIEARSLVGFSDLDGDGQREVVVARDRGAVAVLHGTTGRMLWEFPAEERGLGVSARLGDLDGDGVDELYVGPCVQSAVGATVYSFRDGYAAPRRLWQLPVASDRCAYLNDLLVDLDGDGTREVVMAQGDTAMRVLDGRSGVLRWTIPAPASGSFTQMSIPLAVDLDGVPGRELVVVTNTVRRGVPGYGARRVAVFDPPGPTRSEATLRWEAVQPEPDGGGLAFVADSVGDLDGDGHPEVAFSFYDAAARRWDLTVRDAATGAVRASRQGFELVGVLAADATDAGRPVLLGVQDDQATAALTLADATLSVRWTIPARRPALALDPERSPRVGLAMRPLALQLDADPARELLTTVFDPALPAEARTVTTLVAYDLVGGTPTPLGTLEAPAATTMLTFQSGANLSRSITQPLVVTSDGYLLALDEALRPTNRLVGTEFTIPGMRVGGFYGGGALQGATPIIGSLPGAAGPERAVLVRDSRPALLRLDARRASLSAPPTVRWERPRAAWPVIADLDGDGANDLAALDGRALLSIEPAQGSALRWSVDDAGGPLGSTVVGDLLPMRSAGTPGADLVFLRVDPGSTVRPSSFRGRDGALRWNSYTRVITSGISGFAVADLSGDGVDDLLTTLGAVARIDGRDGTAGPDGYPVPYGWPIVSSWSGADREVYLQASLRDGFLGRDLQLRGQLPDVPLSVNAGATLQCANAPALVLTPQGSSELRVIRPQDLTATGAPPSSATLARAALAGGRRYESSAMIPAAVRRGALGNATTVADGDDTHRPTVLVGSTDGWLYALDGCTLALRWAHDFHYPVGEPVVGDVDGDGADDVIVTVGDGYLYALGARTLDPTGAVRDTDPNDEASDVDLDEVETFDTVTARWNPVPGATRYQVRVTTFAGTGLQYPEYVEVTGERARIAGLALRVGSRYRVGVVAVGADGSSAESASDGFTIVDVSPPSIRISANPGSFAPPTQTTNLEVTFEDRTGLSATRAELLDPDGAVVRVLVDETLRAPLPSRTTRFTFDGIAADGVAYLPPGVYTVRATATDVRDHATTATGTFTVLPRVVTPGTRRAEADAGCACTAGRADHAARSLWLLGAAAALAGRRRRRSASGRGVGVEDR